MTRHDRSGTTVLVFAKAPKPGHAKTRLIPVLGAAGAARLQAAMTRHALDVACRAGVGDVQLWCTPSHRHPAFIELGTNCALSLHTQCSGTLGDRLRDGHDSAFERYRQVLIIGTDCPALTEPLLQAVASDIARHDALLVPAEDGGYVLLALSRPCPEVFSGIDWGSGQVLEQTLERLRANRRRFCVYESLWDVDRPEDLERVRRSMPHLVDDL